MQPYLGDGKILHVKFGEESHFEAKNCNCVITRDKVSGMYQIQHQDGRKQESTKAAPYLYVFTWRAQWDYLYSRSRYGVNKALFVPRDKIPKSWWTAPKVKDSWVEWPRDELKAAQKYIINTDTALGQVKAMEKILRRNPSKAQDPLEMNPMPASALLGEGETDVEDDSTYLNHEVWETNEYKKGHGSAAHGTLKEDTYAQWASEILIEICRARYTPQAYANF